MYPANSRSHKSPCMDRCVLSSVRYLATSLIPGHIWRNPRVVHNLQAYTQTLHVLKNLALHPHLTYNPHRRTRSA